MIENDIGTFMNLFLRFGSVISTPLTVSDESWFKTENKSSIENSRNAIPKFLKYFFDLRIALKPVVFISKPITTRRLSGEPGY